MTLLALPFVLLGALVRWSLPRIGDDIARGLRTVAPLPLAAPDSGAEGAERDLAPPVSEDRAPRARAAHDHASPRAAASGVLADAAARASIFVPSKVVLRAAERKTVGGVNVVGPDGRPSGVRLSGVGGLGSGLHDGDVIVAIEGTPTPTADQATAAITHAVGNGKRFISGTIVRDGERMDVTVELPEIKR